VLAASACRRTSRIDRPGSPMAAIVPRRHTPPRTARWDDGCCESASSRIAFPCPILSPSLKQQRTGVEAGNVRGGQPQPCGFFVRTPSRVVVQWAGLGGGALAHAGSHGRRSSNPVNVPAHPIWKWGAGCSTRPWRFCIMSLDSARTERSRRIAVMTVLLYICRFDFSITSSTTGRAA
jgi:hypothetical protein